MPWSQPVLPAPAGKLRPHGHVFACEILKGPLEVLLSSRKTALRRRGVEYLLELLRGLAKDRLWVRAPIGQNGLHDRVKRGIHLLGLPGWFGAQPICRVDERLVVVERTVRVFDIQR